MNTIFAAICLISFVVLTIKNPDGVLLAATGGATKAVTLSITLSAIYLTWSGILQIAEKSGLCEKLSRILAKPLALLFPKADRETKKLVSINVSANLLGMGGVATPPAISATKRMTERGDDDGATTLFVLTSTSVQLLPSTVISLRQNAGSLSPTDIFLPTLLSTLASTIIGLTLCKIFENRRHRL